MHGLVWQRTEFTAQRCDHPARQIEVTLLRSAEVLLDRNHLLLGDKTMPATKRLRVIGRVCIIGFHIGAHDLCGVFRNIETRRETVLDRHASSALWINSIPARAIAGNGLAEFLDSSCVSHFRILL